MSVVLYREVQDIDHTVTDEVLAGQAQQGQADAFGVLVERYQPKLLRYGRKFLSNGEDIVDIVQDIFLHSYQNIQSFDTTRSFSPWIYRIAHNAFVNGLKKHSRNPLVLVDFDTLLYHPAYEDPKENEREHEEIKKLLDKSLEQLAPKYREVLILYYLEDIPYKEIADILQIPTSTVGIRLKRAREALKKVYSAQSEAYDRH